MPPDACPARHHGPPPSPSPVPARSRRIRPRAALGIALAGGVALAAAAPPEPSGGEPFDLDRDGRVGSEEFRQFLLDRIRLPLSALDEDGDGRVTSAELAHFGILLGSVEQSVAEYRTLHPGGLDAAAFADYAGIAPPEPPPPPSWFERTGVLVRGKLEPVGSGTAAKPLAAVGAATLSFSHDLRDGKAWSTLKGVLMRPIRHASRPDLSVTPSLAVNQVRYRERARSEVDTLGLRLSLERLYRLGGNGPLESVGWRANPTYITDTDSETHIVSAELELQATPSAAGARATLPSAALGLRWQPALLAEYGRVLADPDTELADEDERFGRIGPALDVELRFDAFEELSLGLSWQYLASVIGRQRDRRRVELALNLALDRAGHFSLQALYVDGDTSAKLEDEAYWSLGLGVKY